MKRMQAILVLAGTVFAPLCQANDFPTADRVEFVLECMRDHTGGQFELLNKCSCTVDRLAERYKYDEFVEAQTMAKAVTIAGERGSTLRDNEDAQKAAKRYRASVTEAGRACFLR
ncbi:MAG TPA: hypothetical protein VKD04_02460 [Burkholderiales bacterium]|nr:hypothetical protein [Burkholderiales bacterium]